MIDITESFREPKQLLKPSRVDDDYGFNKLPSGHPGLLAVAENPEGNLLSISIQGPVNKYYNKIFIAIDDDNTFDIFKKFYDTNEESKAMREYHTIIFAYNHGMSVNELIQKFKFKEV